jgi:hypothetical protein
MQYSLLNFNPFLHTGWRISRVVQKGSMQRPRNGSTIGRKKGALYPLSSKKFDKFKGLWCQAVKSLLILYK